MSIGNPGSDLELENGDHDLIRAQNEGVGLELLAMQELSAPANFPGSQMLEEDFIDHYGKEMVGLAQKRAIEMKQSQNVDIGTFAAVAETVPLLGNTFDFFGKDVEVNIYTSAPSEDYGTPNTDLIFEIKNQCAGELARKYGSLKSTTRFMVDVTIADKETVRKKIERSEESFNRGRLHYLHYFRPKSGLTATLGISNAPNLILPINETELISFLRQVKPYMDAGKGEIIDRKKFGEYYQSFAESLRQSLYRQVVEQINAFLIACTAEHIINDTQRVEINDLVEGGDVTKAYDYVDKLMQPTKNNGNQTVVNVPKRNGFLQSLKVLVETAMSLELIREKRGQSKSGFEHLRRAA